MAVKSWFSTLAAAALISACGGGGSGPPSPPPPPPSQTSEGTLSPNVRVLTEAENAAYVRQTDGEIVYAGTLDLAPNTVVLGSDVAFKAESVSHESGNTVVTITTPEIDELFQTLRIQGEYSATADQATPAESGTGPSGARERIQQASSADTFAWTNSFAGGSLTVTNKLSGGLKAFVDYDFQTSKGGLQKSEFGLDTNAVLTTSVEVQEVSKLEPVEKLIGSVRIPIRVSVFDTVAGALGFRLVSIYVPFYIGASASSEFRAAVTTTLATSGKVTVSYDAATGPHAKNGLISTAKLDFPLAEKPSDAPPFASFRQKLSLYVRASPSLAFLNSVAMLGVNTKAAANATGVLQAVEGSPPYCLKAAVEGELSVFGFFKTAGFKKETDASSVSIPGPSLPPRGACGAPVTLEIAGSTPTTGAYGQPLTLVTSVALDPASGVPRPDAAPTGTVNVEVGELQCTATLGASAANAAKGDCRLAPQVVGDAVPVRLTYSGDATYSAATRIIPIKLDRAQTVVGLSTNPNPSDDGDVVIFSASVLPSPAGEGEPTGTLIFEDAGTGALLCQTNITSAGHGECKAPTLGAGEKSYRVTYSGDTHFAASSRSGHKHAVRAVGLAQARYVGPALGPGAWVGGVPLPVPGPVVVTVFFKEPLSPTFSGTISPSGMKRAIFESSGLPAVTVDEAQMFKLGASYMTFADGAPVAWKLAPGGTANPVNSLWPIGTSCVSRAANPAGLTEIVGTLYVEIWTGTDGAFASDRAADRCLGGGFSRVTTAGGGVKGTSSNWTLSRQ